MLLVSDGFTGPDTSGMGTQIVSGLVPGFVYLV